jgi:hypothetical protein
MDMPVFNARDLRQLVDTAGKALQEEDAYVADCFKRRASLYQGTYPPGILWRNDEHYYQFVMAHGLLCRYPLRAALEEDRFDLSLYPTNATSRAGRVAVGEIKRWMAVEGEGTELENIQKDFKKVSRADCTGFLLVLSANPSDLTQDNIEFLTGKLVPAPAGVTNPFTFPTHGYPYDRIEQAWTPCEFWVAAFLAPQGSPNAK